MGLIVTGVVRTDPDVYVNRAGDATVSLDVVLNPVRRGARKGAEEIAHISIDHEAVAERVQHEITAGTEVTVTGTRIQVETWHPDGPRAVVVANDIRSADRAPTA